MRPLSTIKSLLIIAFLSFQIVQSTAQTGVSINSTGTAPDAQAILDISSTTKGALLPRMTTAQATTLAGSLNAGDDGMIIYDIDTKSYKYWDGGALTWQVIPNVANTGNTLDDAYDEGGAGAGRIINASNGNVEIQGVGHLTVAANVGIGTTTPSEKLDVVGNITVSGNTTTNGDFFGDIHVDDTRSVNSPPTTYDKEVAFDFKNRSVVGAPGSGTYSGMMTIAPWGDNSGNASHQINFNEGGLYWRQGQPDNGAWGTWYQILTTADGLPTGSGTTNYLARWTSSSNLGIGTTYDNGTNVGIGTAAPSRKLHVYSTDDDIVRIQGADHSRLYVDGTDGSEKAVIFSEGGTEQWKVGMDNANGAGGSTDDFVVKQTNNGIPEMVVQASSGNVGIGTTTPNANLNVGDAAGGSVLVTREATATIGQTLGSLYFDAESSAVSTIDAPAVIRGLASETTMGNSNKGGHLSFLTKANGSGLATAATEHMRITESGNVGIGTAAPLALLDLENATQYPIRITRTGNVADVGIEFHDNNTNAQTGYLAFDHRDANSIGNGASFHFKSSEATKAVIIDGPGGYYANTEVALRSNGNSYLTGGNLGIGTTAPTQAFHAVGTARLSSLTTGIVRSDVNGVLSSSATLVGTGLGDNLGNHAATTTLDMNNFNVNEVNALYINDPGDQEGIIWTGSAAKIFVSPLNSGNSDGYLRLINDGGIVFEPGAEDTEQVTFTAAGLVGVGTTAPSQKLHVVGSSLVTGNTYIGSTDAYFYRDAANRIATPDQFYVQSSSANTYLYSTNTYLGNTTGDGIHLRGNYFDWTGGSGGIINTNGYVGIGTTAPGNMLEVEAATGAAIRISSSAANQANAGTLMFDELGSNNYTGNTNCGFLFRHDGSANKLHLDGGCTAQTNLVTFLRTGNVGIGTAAPTFKLHVPSGYIGTDYINTSDNSVGSGISGVMVKAGDNYHRTGTAAGVLSFLGVTAPTGDNLGNHTATTNLNMNNREIDNVNYLDVRAGNGYGVRFWQSNSYAINMGNASEYLYGPVTDYSIKMNMSNTAGRGWTWGVDGLTPVAAINTSGDMQIQGNFSGKQVNAAYSNVYRMGGYYFTWDSDSYGTNTHHSIRSTYGDSYGDNITLNSYNHIRFNMDANNNNGTSYFELGDNTTATGNIIFRVQTGGDITLNGKHAIRSNDSWLRLNQNNSFGSGTYTPYLVRADGGFNVDGNTVIDNNAGWHRTYGATGWYNGTYGGGWYMTDGTYVRSYNPKAITYGLGTYNTASYYNGYNYGASTSDGHRFLPNANAPGTTGWGYVGQSNTDWYYMYSDNFTNTSQRAKKRDIQPLDENMMAYVMKDIENMKPSFYKYKSESDEMVEGFEAKYRPNMHLGVILDETPDYLQDQAFSGVDIYAMGVMALTGVKYQQQQIKDLQRNQYDNVIVGSAEMTTTSMVVELPSGFCNDGETPIINITPTGANSGFYVSSADHKSFTVRGNVPFTFNWQATRLVSHDQIAAPVVDRSLAEQLVIDQAKKDQIKAYWAKDKAKIDASYQEYLEGLKSDDPVQYEKLLEENRLAEEFAKTSGKSGGYSVEAMQQKSDANTAKRVAEMQKQNQEQSQNKSDAQNSHK